MNYASSGINYRMHQGSKRFHELLQEIGDLHDRKQLDYGSAKDPFANVRASEEFGIPSWVGALVRLNDKVVRLKQFAQRGSLANESAKDSMLDIAVYALISYVLYEEEETWGPLRDRIIAYAEKPQSQGVEERAKVKRLPSDPGSNLRDKGWRELGSLRSHSTFPRQGVPCAGEDESLAQPDGDGGYEKGHDPAF